MNSTDKKFIANIHIASSAVSSERLISSIVDKHNSKRSSFSFKKCADGVEVSVIAVDAIAFRAILNTIGQFIASWDVAEGIGVEGSGVEGSGVEGIGAL